MYPKLWAVSGISYSKLLDQLINLALQRWREKSRLRTTWKQGSALMRAQGAKPKEKS
jgi:hypothetical protein